MPIVGMLHHRDADGRRFLEHDLFCIIRDVAGDLVENVTLVDT